jgi:lipoate-protein ligase B
MSQPSTLIVETRRHSPASPWTYELLDQRQREIAERVRAGGAGALLLSEVAPVITVGRRTPATDLQLPVEELQRMGVGLHRTDRGGMATWHGPGQWIVFAVDHLERLTGDPRGVRKAVQSLLQIANDMALEVGLTPELHGLRVGEGCEMGVWSQHGKFAAVGVHIEQGVLLHGLAINFYRTPTSFVGFRPCGLDAAVSYLLADEFQTERFEKLGKRLAELALHQFGIKQFEKAVV